MAVLIYCAVGADASCIGAARSAAQRRVDRVRVCLGVGRFSQGGLDEPLGLPVIRYVIRRCLAVRLFPKGRRRYGEPILDTGRREHEGAGRPSIDSGLRARARYMAALATFPDAP